MHIVADLNLCWHFVGAPDSYPIRGSRPWHILFFLLLLLFFRMTSCHIFDSSCIYMVQTNRNCLLWLNEEKKSDCSWIGRILCLWKQFFFFFFEGNRELYFLKQTESFITKEKVDNRSLPGPERTHGAQPSQTAVSIFLLWRCHFT